MIILTILLNGTGSLRTALPPIPAPSNPSSGSDGVIGPTDEASDVHGSNNHVLMPLGVASSDVCGEKTDMPREASFRSDAWSGSDMVNDLTRSALSVDEKLWRT